MKKIILSFCLFISLTWVSAQTFHLFSSQIKNEYPSVVYDFLERYLYELDSLQSHHVYVEQKMRDDKVVFLTGNASTARYIKDNFIFGINKIEGKYYQVTWTDTLGNKILEMAFPMQYELLLGKAKVEIARSF